MQKVFTNLLLIICTTPVSAVFACDLHINSSDVLASVFVDGLKVGPVPQMVTCSDIDRSIEIRSRDGQVFARQLPAKGGDPQDSLSWNVVFASGEAGTSVKRPLAVGQNTLGFEEARFLVEKIGALEARLQELEGEQKRSISSLTTTSETKSLFGTYLRLHAFKHAEWSEKEIQNELGAVAAPQDSASLHYCKAKIKNSDWTLVYWGPFESQNQASVLAQKFRREVLIVNRPECQQ